MDTVKFGFIGAGKITHSSAAAIAEHPHAEVVAAHDPNTSRLADLCEKFSIERSHPTAEELLADETVDAVYIAVPNKFHAPLARQALAAGKHVILDKPMALSHAEALQVAEAAEKSGKIFFLGMNQRYTQGAQQIRSLVEQGVLGEIYHAKAYWFRREGIPRLGTWFGNREVAGAGSLFDIGVHCLDLCLHLLGNFKPVSVSGASYTKFGNRGLGEGGWGLSDPEDIVFDVEDFASAIIRFENGATVTLDAVWACHMEESARNNVELYGTEAGACTHPPKLFRRNPLRSNYEVIDDLGVAIRYPHCNRFHNFINHLRGTETLGVSIEEALAIQKILDAIRESAKSGREVPINR